jgi:hypothetical protein
MDSAAFVPASWNLDEVRHAWVYVQVLAELLNDRPVDADRINVVVGGRPTYLRMTKADLAALKEIAIDVRKSDTANDFLKRAAILHTDTIRFISANSGAPSSNVSMLMPGAFMIHTQDGRQLSTRTVAVHWEFARVLLDHVANPHRDTFVRDWYRATLKYKLGIAEYDPPHFDHAMKLFPTDAEIRFLAGCLHEGLADPRVQAARANVKLTQRAQLAFDGTDAELARAQQWFRAALDLDPAHAEARLRLGRTLHRRDRTKEAVDEFRRAIDLTSEPRLRYYAHMFLGASLEALDRLDEARHAFEQALALFPDAQAPRVALSQLAHRQGDRAQAAEALRGVMVPVEGKSPDDDPWWTYQVAAGRRSLDALNAIGRRISRVP